MGIADFSVWLGDGGRLFCGGWEIVIVVRAQGGVLGVDLHEVFIGEVGVIQGARDRSWVVAVRGGLTAELLGFLFERRVAVFFEGVGSLGLSTVPRGGSLV